MTSGKHILIVDDYPDALDVWALYLRSMGYRVSTATDGASAIAQAERLLPDDDNLFDFLPLHSRS